MPRRLALKNFLRKGGRVKHAASSPPSSTTRPARYRDPPKYAAADKENKEPARKTNHGLFHKNKGPGGLEVTTAATSASGAPHDEVSVITPVTGLPPDSPGRLRHLPLPPLLPPPQPMTTLALYAGTAPTPSRGDMRIDVPARRTGSSGSEDDVSAMSSSEQQREPPRRGVTPPRLLGDDDDDESRELTVYEENEEDELGGSPSGGGGRSRSPLGRMKRKLRFSPKATRRASPPKAEPAGGDRRMLTKDDLSRSRRLINGRKSWLTRTEFFEKAVDSSFAMIDVDGSGDVTLEELHAGLLLIHLKIAVYAGAPACRPASKEYVTEIFHLMDTDDSGTLSKEEFAVVMKVLYSQVFTRIVIQWGLTLMIVPVISQYIVKYTLLLHSIVHEFWKDVHDDLDPMERLLWKIWGFVLYLTPQAVDRTGELVWMALRKVPEGVWKSVPYTVLTLAQTSVALPYALNHVEDFFRRAARQDVGEF